MSHPPGTLGSSCRAQRCPCPQVSMQYNPGWNSSSVNLLHVQAAGPEDSLHYVWSSIGAPAVLLVATQSPSSALRVNWTQLLSASPAGAIWIDPPDSVVYSTAVVFTKVPLARGCPGTAEDAEGPWAAFQLQGNPQHHSHLGKCLSPA